jgi:hypothetical protein
VDDTWASWAGMYSLHQATQSIAWIASHSAHVDSTTQPNKVTTQSGASFF